MKTYEMQWELFGCKISLSPLLFTAITILMMTDKTGILPYIIAATALHEAGHITALILVKNPPKEISLDIFSLTLQPCHPYTRRYELYLVSFAGAAVNLLFFALSAILSNPYSNEAFFALAGANLSLGLFNLLPVKGLDGGDIFGAVCQDIFGPGPAKKIINISSILCFCLFLLAGMIIFIKFRNPALLIFSTYTSLIQPIFNNISTTRTCNR